MRTILKNIFWVIISPIAIIYLIIVCYYLARFEDDAELELINTI